MLCLFYLLVVYLLIIWFEGNMDVYVWAIHTKHVCNICTIVVLIHRAPPLFMFFLSLTPHPTITPPSPIIHVALVQHFPLHVLPHAPDWHPVFQPGTATPH